MESKDHMLSKSVLVLVMLLTFVGTLSFPADDAYAYNKPWDQGHDSTDPDDPEEDDDECKEPPCEECKASGSPVVFTDGSYHKQFVDLVLPGSSDLLLRRYYRSKNSFRTGYFGNGWSSSFELVLREVDDPLGAEVVVLLPNGQKYRFKENGDGTYTPPAGTGAVLQKLSGGGYLMEFVDDLRYQFDDQGRLEQIQDQNGNATEITYFESCIHEVSGTGGRKLTFTKGVNGKIASVTDSAGRTVQYGYDDQGNLTSVTDPLGNSQSLVYQSPDLLASVTDFSGNVIASASYDADGRVYQLLEEGIIYNYSYPNSTSVVRTDPDGSWTFGFDNFGLVNSVTDPGGNTQTKSYDQNGNLLSETDAGGNTTTYTYDALGNVLTVTDPLGNVVTFTYVPGTTRVATSTDPNGIVTKFEYDAAGNVTALHKDFGGANQTTAYYQYDAMGNRIQETDPNGNVTTRSFDAAGRVTSSTKAGTTLQVEYDAQGNRSRMVFPDGTEWNASYDALGRQLSETNPAGGVVSHSYDANGNRIATTDANGNTDTYEYDANGNVVKITDALGNVQQYEYDSKGRKTKYTDGGGEIEEYTYNYLGLPTSVKRGSSTEQFSYDAVGNMLSHTNGNGDVIQFIYDGNGQRSTRTSAGGDVAVYSYDALGRRTAVDFPGTGIQLQYTYDALGRLVSTSDTVGVLSTRSYDANGNVISETDATGNQTDHEYDAFGRVIKKTYSDGSWQAFTYDANNTVQRIVNSIGEQTDFTYDGLGRITSMTDSRGTESTSYDANGNRTSYTDQNGNTTLFEYDAENQLVKEIYPDGSQKQLTYYPDGKLQSVTDRNGNTTSYQYNAQGLLTLRDYPGTNDDAFSYDAAGNLISAGNANVSVTRTYDADGRLLQETTAGMTVDYAHDLASRTTQITYPGGRQVTKQFDVRGRLVAITEGGVDVIAVDYDSSNKPTRIEYANGADIDYSYANGLPTQITHTTGGSPLLEQQLDYLNGSLSSSTRTDDPRFDQQFSYDLAGRLTQELIGTPVAESNDYTLDGVDNWLDHNSVSRTVNNLNQYLTIGGQSPFSYDSNGNMLGDGGFDYEYDHLNRIVRVTRSIDGVEVARYVYGPLGRRIAVTEAGVETRFSYDEKGQLLEEQVSGATTATYLGGAKPAVFAMNRNGADYFFHQDMRGSVIKVTDGLGDVVEEYAYDAYGNRRVFDGSGIEQVGTSIGNQVSYAGSMMDEASGLYYMVNRYYSPSLGRFTSTDPVGYQEGGNLYAYAHSDPINNSDIWGLSSEKCTKTQEASFSAEGEVFKTLNKFKIGIQLKPSGGVKFQYSECTKECCKDGKVVRSPTYRKGDLAADLGITGSGPIPAWGFSAPILGDVGVFATVSIAVTGSGHYEESVNSKCVVSAGGKVCVTVAGSVGLKAGFEFLEGAAEAWLKGGVGPSGQVCYGSSGWEWQICMNAGASLEVSVKITKLWSYGNSFNIASGKICYGNKGASGSYQILFWETQYL